jgi:hypothetical protein
MFTTDIDITDGSIEFRLALIQRSTPRLGGCTIPTWFQPTDWPTIAARMLAAGWDGVALSELAGEGTRTDDIEIRNLVERAIAEHYFQQPRVDEAIWCVTLMQCRLAAHGQITPKQAADTVVAITRGAERDTREWELYLDFAEGEEWDDVPELRASIEQSLQDTTNRYNDRHGDTIAAAILSATSARP